jgi:hypothetical protein
MQSLKVQLKNKLKNARRITILGVGSKLRSDDAAGILAAESIGKKIIKAKNRHFRVNRRNRSGKSYRRNKKIKTVPSYNN